MRIGGIVHNSLSDWEGKVVSVIFTKGCNFRCGYCHNPFLVLPELMSVMEDITVDDVLSILEERRTWIDGVVVSGGEPTIHPDLPDFLSRLKAMGLTIKLDTNGSNPEMLSCLTGKSLVDFVAMDIKTVTEVSEYVKITGCLMPGITDLVKESVSLLRNSGIQYQFRTTVIPGFHTDGNIARLKHEFRDDPYLSQQFRAGDTVNDYLIRRRYQPVAD